MDDAAVQSAEEPFESASLVDEDGFSSFYLAQHARIERALILTLGDREFGRDATAEGFTKALVRWREVESYANPGGWVFRVGVNWARSRRRRKRREVSPGEFPRIIATDSMDDGVENDVVLAAALAQLTVEHRIVIVGRYYLDWSEADLAIALDIPAGTVKSRSSRALARLAELLEDPR